MRALSEQEVLEWCTARGIEVTSSGRFLLANQGHRTMALAVPTEPARRVALACALLLLDSESGDDSEFQGSLFCVTDSDIWSPTLDKVGQLILHSLGPIRAGTEAADSYLMSSDELITAQALVSIPLLFEWDAYLLPVSANFLIFISHDGPVEISTKSQQQFEEIYARLETREWDVRERLTRPRP